MTDSQSVMASMNALLGVEPEAADAFLIAAVYCRAIREDVTPRNIADSLFKAMPDSNAWPALRTALLEVLRPPE